MPCYLARPLTGALFGVSDLACHIDGFIATAAHTLLVQPDAAALVEGRSAEIMAAAHTALEAALRLVRPGKSIAEARSPPRVLKPRSVGQRRSGASCGLGGALQRRAAHLGSRGCPELRSARIMGLVGPETSIAAAQRLFQATGRTHLSSGSPDSQSEQSRVVHCCLQVAPVLQQVVEASE